MCLVLASLDASVGSELVGDDCRGSRGSHGSRGCGAIVVVGEEVRR